ncbi:cupin domain-containing protein [Conexibacter sp. SYSU D00693]|uniref:cupin domain-containing protein n=1 Tax=Conexibacter sp. SYSU D00693 TaxID=2812560 RepID=UPI00196B2592|nr:cupin domain-containing protein [Conexibacter sp. SYSU D00693]
MGSHATKRNLLTDVEDQAAKHGMGAVLEGRFLREQLDAEGVGLSLQRIKPGQRVPFGHRHRRQEELYVVVRGGGRAKVEDEVLELGQWDVLRVAAAAWRGFEAGPDGLDVIAFGAPAGGDRSEAETEMGWWAD